MPRFWNNGSLTVRWEICLIFALALLLIPLRWLGAWITATVIHELCHYLALRICGVPVYGVSVMSGAIRMETGPISGGKELFCTLAGPVGALLTLFCYRQFPATAVCVCVQSLYNLQPIFPLDGGRALRCAAEAVFSEKMSKAICRAAAIGFLFLALCAGFYGTFLSNLGPLPLLAAITLFFRAKTPCKEGNLRVQ